VHTVARLLGAEVIFALVRGASVALRSRIVPIVPVVDSRVRLVLVTELF
jgi:hypothetical protein